MIYPLVTSFRLCCSSVQTGDKVEFDSLSALEAFFCDDVLSKLTLTFTLLVAVDIVAKAEHVQLGQLCRKRDVARMSNVLSTL